MKITRNKILKYGYLEETLEPGRKIKQEEILEYNPIKTVRIPKERLKPRTAQSTNRVTREPRNLVL